MSAAFSYLCLPSFARFQLKQVAEENNDLLLQDMFP